MAKVVFVVHSLYLDDSDIHGIFETQAEAEAAQAKVKEHHNTAFMDVWVQEHPIGEVTL